MSASHAGLARFAAVLALPGFKPLLAAAFVGRLPISMLSLGIVLLVSQENGSYATAGAVAATQAFAAGVTQPLIGRLIDRLGQTPVLVTCAIAFPISVAALIAVAETRPDPLPLIACAIPFGVSYPPLFAAGLFVAPWAATSAALVSRLAPPGAVTEAYTWEMTAFVLGFALGGVTSGFIVEDAGVPEALLTAAVLAGAAGAIGWVRRETMRV